MGGSCKASVAGSWYRTVSWDVICDRSVGVICKAGGMGICDWSVG